MGQVCRLFKWCQNLPPEHCGAGVQSVQVVTELTSRALWGSGAGGLSGVGNYLPGTVGQGCKLIKMCRNLPSGY